MELSQEQVQVWAWRLSLLTAAVVGLLGWRGGVEFPWLILRMFMAFGLIYGLLLGSFFLFEKGGAEAATGIPPGRGTWIDLAISDDTAAAGELDRGVNGDRLGTDGGRMSLGSERAGGMPGQVKPGLATGLPDSEHQAEIVRRMGWEK
ncbi:MAG: hypothetical protein ACYCVD_00110 [Desulfitobacteriaceae bacterium]